MGKHGPWIRLVPGTHQAHLPHFGYVLRRKGRDRKSRELGWPKGWRLPATNRPTLGPGSSIRRACVHLSRILSTEVMKSLVFMNDSIWTDPDRPVIDLRQRPLIEVEDREELKGILSTATVRASESVTVFEHQPQRVVLHADLEHPGLLILADTFFPGWHLAIDGKPETIYRTNRMMRSGAMRHWTTHARVYLSTGIIPYRREPSPWPDYAPSSSSRGRLYAPTQLRNSRLKESRTAFSQNEYSTVGRCRRECPVERRI